MHVYQRIQLDSTNIQRVPPPPTLGKTALSDSNEPNLDFKSGFWTVWYKLWRRPDLCIYEILTEVLVSLLVSFDINSIYRCIFFVYIWYGSPIQCQEGETWLGWAVMFSTFGEIWESRHARFKFVQVSDHCMIARRWASDDSSRREASCKEGRPFGQVRSNIARWFCVADGMG